MPLPPDASVSSRRACIAATDSFEALGDLLVSMLRQRLAFDRFNIGLLDMTAYAFTDAYVFGRNVKGRAVGHKRTLEGTVVAAGIAAGHAIHVGGDPVTLLGRFPGFGPVLDSGMRAMLAAPLYHGGVPVSAMVLASSSPDAFDDGTLDCVNRLGAMAVLRIIELAAARPAL